MMGGARSASASHSAESQGIGQRAQRRGATNNIAASGDDPDREEPPMRPRRAARALVQVRAIVAMTGKTDGDQFWRCTVVFDGGGFCHKCVTELQEQCVQDDVRLVSYAAELARTVGDVVACPNLDHRDEVEQLMGHQGVAYVRKILDTNDAILTESGRRESLKVYFILREKAVHPLVELDSIQSDARSLSEVDRKRRRRSAQSTTGCDGKCGRCTTCGLRSRQRPRHASYRTLA